MASISDNAVAGSQLLSGVILWFSNTLSKFIASIGFTEIFIIALIGCAVYFWFTQHNLEPKRVLKF